MRSGPAVVVIACALAGCADDEGLVLDVVVADTADAGSVRWIDVWIGVSDQGSPTEFVRSQVPGADDRQPVDQWPFRILVVPGDQPQMVWAGGFGYLEGAAPGARPYVMGSIPAPILVGHGTPAVQVTMTLFPTFAPDADCVFRPARVGAPPLVIRPGTPGPVDCDNDGRVAGPLDCDDLHPETYYMAPELCDGRDNNCNTICDDGLDADGDGYSSCTYDGTCVVACDTGVLPPYAGPCDCDDSDLDAHPGQDAPPPRLTCGGTEDLNCDGVPDSPINNGTDLPGNQIDENCDGNCDDDRDGDGIAEGSAGGGPGTWAQTCEVAVADCNDGDGEIFPNALELCDGANSDCSELLAPVYGVCFVDTPTGCMIGRRSCADAPGTPGWQGCTPVQDASSGSVGDELCVRWPDVADAPWPERAAYDLASAAARETCTLAVWRPPGAGGVRHNAICPDARARIPNRLPGAIGACETVIATGGLRYGGWDVQLRTRDPAAPITATRVPSCDVELVVGGIAGDTLPEAAVVRFPSSVWVLVIQQKVEAGMILAAVVIPVQLSVAYATGATGFACPPAPRSLVCDEL